MFSRSFRWPAVSLLCVLWPAIPANAQGVGQRQDEIIITASRDGTPTSPSIDEARAALQRVPGAVGLVEDEGFADIFAQSIGDVLELTPGVFADTSAQRESRISVRGSGFNSSFERRGLPATGGSQLRHGGAAGSGQELRGLCQLGGRSAGSRAIADAWYALARGGFGLGVASRALGLVLGHERSVLEPAPDVPVLPRL